MTALGQGYQTNGAVTTFMFPGDPTTDQFWSEVNFDGMGGDSAPGERYGLLASGPFSMQPGETQTFDFAVAFAQGTDHLDSVRRLKGTASVLHVAYDALYALRPLLGTPVPEPPASLRFVRNHPNPVQGVTTFEYDLPQPGHVHLFLFDVLGREVAAVVDADEEAGSYRAVFDASNLASGLYVARFEVEGLPSGGTVATSQPVVVVR